MKFIILIIEILTAGTLLISSAALASTQSLSAPQPGSLCVLIFERDRFPITKAVRDVYEGYPGTYIRTYATPKDMLDCARAGAREIVIVAHLVQLGKDGEYRLGYFQSNKQQDTFHLVLNYPFEKLLETIKSQREQNQPMLQKVRLMSCGPDEVLKAYPVFEDIKKEVEFEQKPQSPIIAAIKGKNAVTFNVDWLAKDIDCTKLKDKWRTDKNNWCEADHWPGCDRETARYCLPARK